jgi:hypothetical protein
MSTLRERITLALESHPAKPKQADLARACGVASPSVTAWFTGDTKTMKGETLLKAARFLCVRPEWLQTGAGLMRSEAEGEAGAGATVVLARETGIRMAFAPSLPEQQWPHSCLALTQWLALTDDERLELDGALLSAYAQLMRRRRERREELIGSHEPPKANIRRP